MLSLEIRKSNSFSCSNSAYFTTPYNVEAVALIKSYHTRKWDPISKKWELAIVDENLDISKIQDIKNRLEKIYNEKCVLTDNKDILLGSIQAKPKVLSDYSYLFTKTKPYQHQIDGVNYGMSTDRFLISDDMGMGKSLQSIIIALGKKKERGYSHCLVICGVNTLKHNWVREIKKHTDESCVVLGAKNEDDLSPSNKAKLAMLMKLPKDYFIITNIETLQDREIIKRLKLLISENEIEMMIYDECHKTRNMATKQAKGLIQLLPKTRIAMTGTPIMNTPLDLYVAMKWLGYECRNYWAFRNAYATIGSFGEITGYKNLNDLHERIKRFMIRRLKKDVLDLPEKIYTDEYLDCNNLQKKLYGLVRLEVKKELKEDYNLSSILAKIIRLRQVTGNPAIISESVTESVKLDRLVDIVEECCQNGKKICIFSNWVEVVNAAKERLTKFNPAIIIGDTKNRLNEVDKVTNDKNCGCIIGTIGAMGTGLNITACDTVVFLDEPWNQANKIQAEDRCFRIGTKNTVNIITLLCRGTIDVRVNQIVKEKGILAEQVIDKNSKENAQKLVSFLLED